MPSDAALLEDEDDLADRYDALIEEIGQHLTEEQPGPAEKAELVRVLAGSFGPGGGMGVYWGTLHLIERCTPSIAYPVIRDRALHGLPGRRSWCCFILGRRRDVDDLPLFLTLENDDVPEVQEQALRALVMLAQAVSLTHSETGGGESATQDRQHPQPAKPKDAPVASIMPIKARPLSVMHAGSGQMGQPAETEKDDEEQSIEARTVGDHCAFQVPATAVAILAGRFDPHPEGILA